MSISTFLKNFVSSLFASAFFEWDFFQRINGGHSVSLTCIFFTNYCSLCSLFSLNWRYLFYYSIYKMTPPVLSICRLESQNLDLICGTVNVNFEFRAISINWQPRSVKIVRYCEREASYRKIFLFEIVFGGIEWQCTNVYKA